MHFVPEIVQLILSRCCTVYLDFLGGVRRGKRRQRSLSKPNLYYIHKMLKLSKKIPILRKNVTGRGPLSSIVFQIINIIFFAKQGLGNKVSIHIETVQSFPSFCSSAVSDVNILYPVQ